MCNSLRALGIGTAIALGSAAACSNYDTDCHNNRDCGPFVSAGAGGNSASAGASGNSNTAGVSAGGTGAGIGGGGEQAGTANGGAAEGGAAEGGAGGSGPCNGACGGAKPVCEEISNRCVECVNKSQCADPKPACDATTNTCVECTAPTDCTDVTKPFCDTTAEQCVACLQQSDCKGAAASACTAGACTACSVDAECADIAGKGVCDAGTCVQCTGSKFAVCGSNAGTPLVCDSLKRTCTTNKQHSTGLCQPCVTDAQCNAGEICLLDKFGTPSADVGYFCHWKKGDTADGAPTLCSSAPPYVSTQTNAISVDGAMSDICTLRISTCVARNQFSSKDCTVAAAPSDAVCGVSPPKDAKCGLFDVGVYRCTMTCGSDDDCPSPFTCNVGVTPAVCNLN